MSYISACKKNRSYLYCLTQRPQRPQNSNANYAAAGVVAGYARQRTQRRKETKTKTITKTKTMTMTNTLKSKH